MKKHALTFLLTLLACCLPSYLLATDEYTLQRIDLNRGLSHSAVLSLYQDDWGTMWLGTYDGLDNYDGRTMEVYRDDGPDEKRLLNNVIYQVEGAGDDCLWIGTNKGINRFSLKKRCVTDSYEMFSGAFWLVSNRRGSTWVYDQDEIFWYDSRARTFINIHHAEKRFKKELSFVDEKDCLWLFSEEDNSVFRYRMDGPGKDSETPVCTAMRANVHPKQIRYASYQSGILGLVDEDMDLYLVDVERDTKVYIRNVGDLVRKYGRIQAIISFFDDIVIAFVQNGLLRLEAANQYQESFIDRNLRIFSVYREPLHNTIWVGTDGQGVAIYSKNHSMGTQLLYTQMEGRITRQVRSIFTDSIGNLWFGTKGDGLVRVEHYANRVGEEWPSDAISVYSPGSKKPLTDYVRGDTEFQVFGIIPSRFAQRLWIGSAERPGLTYYDYRRDAVVALDGDDGKLERVHWLYEENDSTLWMTTSGNGLCRTVVAALPDGTLTARHTRQFIFQTEDGREINDFFPMSEEGDSLLWLGSRGSGLVKFNLRTERYTVYQPNKEVKRSTNDILSIYRKDDVFYLGTVSGLVCMQLDPQGHATYSCIGKEQGFLNDMIHGILEDEAGFLWLSTNKGLVKYNPESKVFHTYYYSNGLRIGEFSDDAYHKCAYTGHLFFGGINGLLYLAENGTREAEYYTDICFRQLTLGGEPVNFYDYYDEASNTLVLNGTKASFTLTFVAPDFVEGDNFEYSYKLEGSDNADWTPFSSESQASFRKLPYGNYTLRVQYKKDAFDTEYPSYTLHIRIVPPWYLSTWAYVAYLLIAVAGAAYMARLVHNHYLRERLIKKLMKQESGASWDVNLSLAGYLPEKSRPETTCVKEVADRVLDNLNDGQGKNPATFVHVELDEDLRTSLPPLSLHYMLHFLCADALRKQVSARLSGRMEGNCLVLLWEVPADYAAKLLTQNGEAVLSEAAHHDFNACLHWWLYVYALQSMEVGMQPDESGRGVCFRFPARPSAEPVPAEPDPDRKTILLLENRMEVAWLVENMLADTYDVHCVHTLKDAFDYLRQAYPAVFLADALIYGKEQQKFMEYVQANKGLLTRTAFVLMLTWESADLLHRRFRHLVDGFVVMPFSILFLRDIVEMAVRRISTDNHALKNLSVPTAKEPVRESPEQTEFMKKLVVIVDENLNTEDLGASFLAEKMFMSPRQFYRKFKDINGNSPTDFIKTYRLEKAARLLAETDIPVTEVVSEVGIVSRSYFYKEFFCKFGMTPKEYRELNSKKTK